MDDKLKRIDWISFMSKAFIIFPGCIFLIFLILSLCGILPMFSIVIISGFLVFFCGIGLLIPFVAKQNVEVAVALVFSFFWPFIFIAAIITLILKAILASGILFLLSILFAIAIILVIMYAKKKNSLYLYRPAKAKELVPLETLLKNCVKDLTNDDEPWEISVLDNTIIAHINWKNTTNFSISSVNREVKDFEYRVILNPNYTYYENMASKSENANFSPGDVSTDKSIHYGVVLQSYDSIEFGINHNTNEKGIIKTSFNTNEIRNKIRTYVEERGYKYKA